MYELLPPTPENFRNVVEIEVNPIMGTLYALKLYASHTLNDRPGYIHFADHEPGLYVKRDDAVLRRFIDIFMSNVIGKKFKEVRTGHDYTRRFIREDYLAAQQAKEQT